MYLINIILLLALFNYVLFYINKGKSNILYCGIVAWAGKNPNKFDKAKFDLVGSYNEERGIHSCGVASDGNISIGVKDNKVYRDFITNVGYDAPLHIPTVIGHTRHATFGVHNADNAHPFGFGDDGKGDYEFIGVHNGSLLNHKDLANQFGVKHKYNVKGKPNRDKIDSEVLLEIIYSNKNYKVLSEYNGAAALVFQDLSKPNVIYCWHGASKKYHNSSEETIWEERPLFYYKETRNSLYISSMKNSLEAIGGTWEEGDDKEPIGTIGQFHHNTLYTITDGNIEKAETLRISRKGRNYMKGTDNTYTPPAKKEKPWERPVNKSNNTKHFNLDGLMVEDDIEDETFYKHQGTNAYVANAQRALNFDTKLDKFNVYTEPKPKVNMLSKTYFWKMRYWKNGNLLKGCYVFIENFGFYFLADTLKGAEDHFWNITNKEFFAGDFVFNGQKFTSKDKAFIPFEHNKHNEIVDVPIFYFYEGVRLSQLLDYTACLDSENNGSKFDWKSLSHCSTHPLIDISYGCKTAKTQAIILKDRLVNDIICPIGSNRIYTIENGNCVLIEIKKKIEVTADKNYDTLDSIMDSIEEYEKGILKSEKKESTIKKIGNISNTSCDLLEKTIDDTFKVPFMQFPLAIKRLQMYSQNPKSQEAIVLLEKFLREARIMVELELKE